MKDQGLIRLYLRSASEATALTYKNWIIFLASIVLYIALIYSSALLSIGGIIGGILSGLLYVAALTLFYGWIRDASPVRAFAIRDLIQFDGELFSNLLGVGFVMYLITGLFDAVDSSIPGSQLTLFANLALVFAFNSIPEVVYINRLDSIHALKRAFQFTRDHFIEWFIPVIVFLLPVISAAPQLALKFFARSSPLLPSYMFYQSAQWSSGIFLPYVVALPAAVLFFVWVSFFRAALFSKLNR